MLTLLSGDFSRSLYRLRLKFVQTTAEVCTDYTCSLQKLQLSAELKYVYLQLYLRVLTDLSTCTH